MNREELAAYISENYNAEAEHPWLEYPNFAVFRHENNRKWFALIMDVPREKLGLAGGDTLDVVNLKCDPIEIGSFREQAGIFPAYHMNKNHWLTVALDGSVSDETLTLLLDISFELTARKPGHNTKQK